MLKYIGTPLKELCYFKMFYYFIYFRVKYLRTALVCRSVVIVF